MASESPSACTNDQDAVYITRHGTREDFINPTWKETAKRPDDSPLAEEGLQQAKELMAALKGSSIRLIFASPMTRTVQTAAVVASVLNVKVRIEYGLIEWNGKTKDVVPLSTEELSQMFPNMIDTNYVSMTPLPTSEGRKFMMERTKQAVNQLAAKYTGHRQGAILLVTHAAPLIGLARGLMGDPLLPVRSGVCSITKLVRHTSTTKWQIELNGDCRHLTGGEQYHFVFPNENGSSFKAWKKQLQQQQQQQQLPQSQQQH